MPKLVDSSDIAERKADRIEKKAAEDAAGLTIAERLTRRAKAQTVMVTIPDDVGDILIEMQIPSWGVVCELTQMETMMASHEGHLRIAEIMSDLCRTPGLDKDFWISGAIGLLDMRLLIEGLTSESIKSVQHVQAAQSFREH